MKKYNISAVYSTCMHCGTVEANSKEEAIEKVYDLGMIDDRIGLCNYCSKKADELLLDDSMVWAEKVE